MNFCLLKKGFIPYLSSNEDPPGYRSWLNELCKNQELVRTECLSAVNSYAPSSVTVLEVVGFTPEWNDGEECLHRTSYFVNGLNDYGEALVYSEDELPYTPWEPEKRKLVERIKAHESLFEKAFGTNWLIGLVRTATGFQFAISSRPPPY